MSRTVVGVGADDAELNREADRRTEIEAVDADAGLRQRAVGDRVLSRALIRSRASTSFATITISAKASFGSCGLRPSQNRGEPWPT